MPSPTAGRSTSASSLRLGAWEFEPEPGLRVGEKLTPISSVGLFVPSGKASYPSVAYQLGGAGHGGRRPAHRAGGTARTGRGRSRRPGRAGRVPQARHRVTCSASTARPASPRSASAPSRSPRCGRSSGPGSPAVTLAQVEMQRHGVATMMLLGPTESAGDRRRQRRPRAPRCRPADRGRARHRLVRRARHPRCRPRRSRRRRARRAGHRSARRPGHRGQGIARAQRRGGAHGRPRRSRRRRQPLRSRAPAGRRRRPSTKPPSSTAS